MLLWLFVMSFYLQTIWLWNNVKILLSDKQIRTVSDIIKEISENIKNHQTYLFKIIFIFSFLKFYIKWVIVKKNKLI